MGTLREDIDEGARWVGSAMRSSGYRADGSVASLAEVDRFLGEHTTGGQARADGLLAEQFGWRVFCLGSYVGEVLRTSVGGEWETDDTDPEGELTVALRLPDGTVVRPVLRVLSRVSEGEEAGIAAYGAALGAVPDQATRRGRSWFRRR